MNKIKDMKKAIKQFSFAALFVAIAIVFTSCRPKSYTDRFIDTLNDGITAIHKATSSEEMDNIEKEISPKIEALEKEGNEIDITKEDKEKIANKMMELFAVGTQKKIELSK